MKIITNINELPNMTVDEISKLDIAIGGDALSGIVNRSEYGNIQIIGEMENSLSKIRDLASKIEDITND